MPGESQRGKGFLGRSCGTPCQKEDQLLEYRWKRIEKNQREQEGDQRGFTATRMRSHRGWRGLGSLLARRDMAVQSAGSLLASMVVPLTSPRQSESPEKFRKVDSLVLCLTECRLRRAYEVEASYEHIGSRRTNRLVESGSPKTHPMAKAAAKIRKQSLPYLPADCNCRCGGSSKARENLTCQNDLRGQSRCLEVLH